MYSCGHNDGSGGDVARERSKDMSLAKFSTIFRQGSKKDAQRFWLFTVHGTVNVHRYGFSATLYTSLYRHTHAHALFFSFSLSLSFMREYLMYIFYPCFPRLTPTRPPSFTSLFRMYNGRCS
jgi:hypothetical protein